MWEHDIPKVSGDGWEATVIAGEFCGCKGIEPNAMSWAADPAHHVSIVRISMKAGTELVLKPTEAATRNLYITEYDAVVEGKPIHSLSRVKLNPKMEATVVMGDHDSDVWLLEGDPIGEVQKNYGPVVLGTYAEVRAAVNVVREKQESDWPWQYVNQKQPLGTHRFFKDSEGNVSEPNGPAPNEHELPPTKQD